MSSEKQDSDADDANRVLEEEAEGTRSETSSNQLPDEIGQDGQSNHHFFSDGASI